MAVTDTPPARGRTGKRYKGLKGLGCGSLVGRLVYVRSVEINEESSPEIRL